MVERFCTIKQSGRKIYRRYSVCLSALDEPEKDPKDKLHETNLICCRYEQAEQETNQSGAGI